MTSENLKKAVEKWAQKIGHKEAGKRLVNADISVSIAQKLITGRYVSQLSFEKAQAILEEMAKDGFSLTDERAS